MSAMPEINRFVQDALHTLLNSVCDGFEDGELAYLSSQGKNELQIRDKIAWRLHKMIEDKYGDQYVVCREWSPNGFGRAKVDLAILVLSPNCDSVISAVALIEFKAQSIVRKENWYIDEFEHDINKMKTIVEESPICKNADMYFVFLETGQEKKVDKFKPIIAYAQYLTSNVKYYSNPDYKSAIKSYWEEFNRKLIKPIMINEPKVIDIGASYGYKQYISPLIIGPLKPTDIK